MYRIYVPSNDAEDWKSLLAGPEKQWKDGFSAKQVAESWHAANGFPPLIADVLANAADPISSLQPLLIIPEHQVALPGGAANSQNDVWILASHHFGLASITVEGKVAESFGENMAQWLTPDASDGKQNRLKFLVELLGLGANPPDQIRYQLLHRLGSAVIEAKRFHANVALCVVQSFSPTNEGLTDFQAFCALFAQHPQPGEVVKLRHRDGVTFYAAWVHCYRG